GSGTKEEMLELIPVSTAVNHVTITSATSGNAPVIATSTADIGIIFADGSGTAEELLVLTPIATATDYVQITSGDGSTDPILSVETSDTNAGLKLDTAGTGQYTFAMGGVETLVFHDAAITLAAENDTAGHALYMQTEDGGADGGSTGGSVGALFEIRTGDGSASAQATSAGGAGGALTIVSGAGLTGNTTGDGGAGGALSITSGGGGIGGADNSEGGDGGAIALTANAGGNAGENASSTGGKGGVITLTAGAAGGAGGSGGTAGKAGVIHNLSPVMEDRTQTAKTDTVTLTPAELLTGVIDGTPTSAANYQMPAAAAMVAEVPGAQVGDSFFFLINNKASGADTITVTAGGASLDGTITVAQNVIRQFFVIFTNVTGASEAYFVYGMG
ncbi:hypothetical protein LCGC14_1845430, partial [marine sediment metagenome]